MTARLHRKHWEKLVSRDRAYFVDKLVSTALPDLSKAIFPEMEVDTYFRDGLMLSYAGEVELATRSLKFAVSLSQHLVKTDRFRSAKSKKYFPVNRGLSLRLEAYSQLALGMRFPEGTLKQSATDILEWLNDDASLDTGDIAQERRLSCAVQRTLTDDLNEAKQILNNSKFGDFGTCRDVFVQAIEAIEHGDSAKSLEHKLMKIVDKYRGPTSDYPVLAFEAFLLYYRVVNPKGAALDLVTVGKQLGR
jgi:hypothetical protein